MQEIVIVDDEPLALDALGVALSGYAVRKFTSIRAAEAWIEQHAVPLAILDLNLGEANGLDVLVDWRQRFPDVDVLFCSGETRVERAIECLRRGASDYIVKPFRRDDVRFLVARVLEKRELRRRAESTAPLLEPAPTTFVGESAAARELRAKVEALRGQTHLNVMILGESGTGKEAIARLLHQQEARAGRPFVVANMPAIPASLMEAELFGVEKGAYTDAKQARAGKFEMAHGGDIFLDEIGDLALDTQAKLLRALQERQIERVGSSRPQPLEFRVVSATNQPLADLIAEGRFREDLVYRLSDMVLWLPPLRERMDDIPLLAGHFLAKYTSGRETPRLSDGALETLRGYSWPGNVRQLESTLKRALVFNRGPVIEKVDIFDLAALTPRGIPAAGGSETHAEWRARHEQDRIETILAKHRGDREAAIAELGISRATFYRKRQKNASRKDEHGAEDDQGLGRG